MLRLIVLLVIFMIGQCHGGTVTTSLYLREEIVSPDGYPRVGITVNGTMPGPPIEANRGDTLIITVFNQMPLATTVHWHGILQTGSYYMDGTAMITQCPIPPSQSFTYRFIVDRAGTFFYHAHLGGQNADGLLGPLIVTEASDPVSYGYDFEYTVFIQDWFHVDAATIDLMKSKGYVEGLTMDSALINGLGTFNCSNYRAPSASTPFSCTENEVTEPSSFQKFQMQPGKRYRFRIICAATTFNFLVSFDGHPLKLINTDGNKIVPVTVDYLHVYSGERYDVIIEANQVPGNYWLRVALPNGSNDVRAILQYTTIPLALPETVANLTRPLNLTELRSTEDMPNYDQTYNIDVSKVVDPANPGQHWAMNGIIFQHPTDDAHPFHIHGHSFWVLGMGNNRSDIYLPRSVNYNAVQKDTVVLPAGGWVAIVVEADNPGYWLFHCHVEWHMPTGMTVLLIDSEKDIDKPPRNFPTCYPYPNGNLNQVPIFECAETSPAIIGLSVAFALVSTALIALLVVIWLRSRHTAGDPLAFSKNQSIELVE